MKRILAFVLAVSMVAALAACRPKNLFVVRPQEMQKIEILREADGHKALLDQAGSAFYYDNIGQLSKEVAFESIQSEMDRIVFDFDEPYNKTGACDGQAPHLYTVTLFDSKWPVFSASIIDAETLCVDNVIYALHTAGDPVDIAQYNRLFALGEN